MSGEEVARNNDSRVLRCDDCGDVYPASTTNDGELVPVGVGRNSRCNNCGGKELIVSQSGLDFGSN